MMRYAKHVYINPCALTFDTDLRFTTAFVLRFIFMRHEYARKAAE